MKNINLILYRTVIVLLSLVIITFSMVSNRFARYSTGDTFAEKANVASFDVRINYGGIIDCGLTKRYPITISNESEVLVGFNKITVQFREALPKGITLVLTDEDGNLLCKEQKSDPLQTEYIFYHTATLKPHISVDFQLQLTQNEREIFEAQVHATHLFVTVYQIN